MLKNKFLGAAEYAEPKPSNVDTSRSIYCRAHAGSPTMANNLSLKFESGLLIEAYERVYGVDISVLKKKIKYWEKLNLQTTQDKHIRTVQVSVGRFVMHAVSKDLYRVDRIMTVSIAGMMRCFLLGRAALRAGPNAVCALAPYKVYLSSSPNETCPDELCALSLGEIEPRILHMVRKRDGEWWLNDFITKFL